jgi:hypothetical protein
MVCRQNSGEGTQNCHIRANGCEYRLRSPGLALVPGVGHAGLEQEDKIGPLHPDILIMLGR